MDSNGFQVPTILSITDIQPQKLHGVHCIYVFPFSLRGKIKLLSPFSAGPSELDLSLLGDSTSLADVPSKFDEQVRLTSTFTPLWIHSVGPELLWDCVIHSHYFHVHVVVQLSSMVFLFSGVIKAAH